jgi:hypothetical protein
LVELFQPGFFTSPSTVQSPKVDQAFRGIRDHLGQSGGLRRLFLASDPNEQKAGLKE